ncbi:MAG: ATP-binding cassette domain-containing protein, partial [Patescibacteria group bacterium]
FEKVNKLGGKSIAMSRLARRIRVDIEEDREEMVEMRREDRTIPAFDIPCQEYVGDIIKIKKPIVTELVKGSRLLIKGPNGIGKSTLLRNLVNGKSTYIKIIDGLRIGYYSQDFTTLNYNDTVFDCLKQAMLDNRDVQKMRAVAANFLITGELMDHKVSHLSEGQKGLLALARLVLMEPGLLVLDEPTNHINFRHIPIIAEAINNYKGAMILISHMPDFVEKIRIDDYLDLGTL